MNVLGAYRRWLARRLFVLLPAVAASLLAAAWIAFWGSGPAWLRIVLLTLALPLAAVPVALSLQTLVCSALHRTGRRAEARPLRTLLGPYRRVTAASLAVLAFLAGLPSFFPAPAALPRFAKIPARDFAAPAPERDGSWTVVEAPSVVADEPPMAVALAPAGEDFEPPMPDIPLPPEPVPEIASEEMEDAPFAHLDLEAMRAILEGPPPSLELDRLGLPDESAREPLPPPEARLDGFLASAGDRAEGGGAAFGWDQPVGPFDSVRAQFFAAVLVDDEPVFEGSPWLTLNHVDFGYLRRLVGYTRHAPLDLAIHAGLSLDIFDFENQRVSEDPRLSPHVGIDAALWTERTYGMIVQARQTIPANLTGGTATVTDLSALCRIDLSDRVSIHFGYRIQIIHLEDYAVALGSREDHDGWRGTLSGPVAGLDVRF